MIYFFKIIGTIACILIGLSMIYVGLVKKPDNYKASDLTYFKVTLSSQPKYVKGRKSSRYLRIHTYEYPYLKIDTYDNNYLHFNTTLEEDLKIGDTITLGIEKIIFDKKISKTKERNFIENYINYNIINYYHLESKNKVYLDVNIHNKLDKKDKKWGLVWSLLGLIPLLYFVSIWSKELIILSRNKGYHKIADKLEDYQNRKII